MCTCVYRLIIPSCERTIFVKKKNCLLLYIYIYTVAVASILRAGGDIWPQRRPIVRVRTLLITPGERVSHVHERHTSLTPNTIQRVCVSGLFRYTHLIRRYIQVRRPVSDFFFRWGEDRIENI